MLPKSMLQYYKNTFYKCFCLIEIAKKKKIEFFLHGATLYKY